MHQLQKDMFGDLSYSLCGSGYHIGKRVTLLDRPVISQLRAFAELRHPCGSQTSSASELRAWAEYYTVSCSYIISFILFDHLFTFYIYKKQYIYIWMVDSWIRTWGEAVHLMSTNRPFGGPQGLSWLLSCAPEIIFINFIPCISEIYIC